MNKSGTSNLFFYRKLAINLILVIIFGNLKFNNNICNLKQV